MDVGKLGVWHDGPVPQMKAHTGRKKTSTGKITHPKWLTAGRAQHFGLAADDNFVHWEPFGAADKHKIGEFVPFAGPTGCECVDYRACCVLEGTNVLLTLISHSSLVSSD